MNFSNEKNILIYLHNGDTIYDVEIPEEAYPKALGGVSLMNISKTASTIFNVEANDNNI